jgi:hypothetical protein
LRFKNFIFYRAGEDWANEKDRLSKERGTGLKN